MKRISFSALLVVLGCSLSGCGTPDRQDRAAAPGTAAAESPLDRYPDPPGVHMGQAIYVPVYSSVFYADDQQTRALSATLFISNIDLGEKVEISRVDYYDTKGQLVRSYLEQPLWLNPLERVNYEVEEKDGTGGTGASFIVVWQAPDEVSPPLVEALMIGTASTGTVSLLVNGKVTRNFGAHLSQRGQ